MTKFVFMTRLYFIIAVLLTVFIRIQADEVRFTASAPAAVEVGEQFRLSFSVNANPSGFQQPGFSSFAVVSGPMSSSSSSVQIINGSVSQSVDYSYTYILQATQEGKYTIEPAKVTVGKKTYLSNALTIEVVKASTSRQSQQQQQQQQQGGTTPVPGGENLFVRVLLSKNTAYRGEPVIATVKIYSKVNLTGINKIEYPGFDGFYKEDIETPPLNSLVRENVDGEIYGTGVLQKYVLFPQRGGKLVISPAKLECVVRQVLQRQPRSIFDDFFGGSYQDVKVAVQSPEVSIQVKDWPPGAPDGFKGAAGHFDLEAKVDKSSVKANEAVTLRITVIGNGNLKLIEKPDITFPADFEVYDPEIRVNVKNSVAGSAGSKSFEYLIIPRHEGKFTIPEVEMAYFDIASKQYKVLKSQPFNLTVEKGAEGDAAAPLPAGVSKEDLKYIGKDIRFIKTGIRKLYKPRQPIFSSRSYLIGYLSLFVLFILFVLYKRNQIKENADIALSRNKRANRKALNRLRTASARLKENRKEQFYEEIVKAVWGYLSDKLIIPVAQLSRETTGYALSANGVEHAVIDRVFELLDECEFARYAPGEGEAQLENVYKRAVELISTLEQVIKKK